MFCREQVARINTIVETLNQKGVSVIGVGNGTPLMAQDFAESFDITFPLYTDPEKGLYQHFGMKRKMGMRLGTLKRAFGTYRSGFRQGRIAGDAFQQGGIVLLDDKGQVKWSHVNDGPGEHAPIDDILAAV